MNLGGPLNYRNNKLTIGRTLIESYPCLSDQGPQIIFIGTAGGPVHFEFATTSYVGLADSRNRFHSAASPGGADYTWRGDSMLYNAFSVRMDQVSDGTSQTLFVSEGIGDCKGDADGLHFSW